MNPANRREAMREVRLDVAEGADIVMVKPAGPLPRHHPRRARRARACRWRPTRFPANTRRSTPRPGWAGSTSRAAGDESLLAIKRAGADMILTYFAKDMAKELAK